MFARRMLQTQGSAMAQAALGTTMTTTPTTTTGLFGLLSATLRTPSLSSRTFSTQGWSAEKGSAEEAANTDNETKAEVETEAEAEVEAETEVEAEAEAEVGAEGEEDSGAVRVAELEEEVGELKDKLLRAYAEMETVRIRAREDVASAQKFGASKFAKSMLDVADSIEKAMEAADESEHGALYDGIAMTYKQLFHGLEENGIVPIRPLGEPFDPALHQALFEIPQGEHPAGHVGIVTRTGYTLNDRILRPAQVGVVQQNP